MCFTEEYLQMVAAIQLHITVTEKGAVKLMLLENKTLNHVYLMTHFLSFVFKENIHNSLSCCDKWH